jgi:TolA-binding protein
VHGQRYLTLLLETGKHAEALRLFRTCRALAPGFEPAAAKELLALARAARSLRDPQAAIEVLRGFDKRYPGNAEIPAVYFFSAQLLFEDLRETAMARRILEHVIRRYPGHALAADSARFLGLIDS